MEYVYFYETAAGRLCIGEEDGAVTRVTWGWQPQEAEEAETPLILACRRQLEEYFAGARQCFSLPLAPKGTPFQQKVWAALREIPYGETRSYGEIARAIGSPKTARAVGMANHRNPLAILIPCHRVIGANGSLTGYAPGLEKKEWLLERERLFKTGKIY